jgi:transcriptional regulator with XRE-family HTH domain
MRKVVLPMDNISTQFLNLRKELGMSQAAFAEKLGLSQNFIWQVEKGQREPSDRTISDICRVYGVNEVWLRTGEGEMFLPKSRKEELMEIFGSALNGVTDKDRFIRAVSQIPDEAFPAFVQFLKTLSEEFQK